MCIRDSIRAELGGEVVRGGLGGEASPHEGDARSSSRNKYLVAGVVVSVTSVQRSKLT